MSGIDHYKVAIATGLTPEQAKLYSLAMSKADAPNINHLKVKS